MSHLIIVRQTGQNVKRNLHNVWQQNFPKFSQCSMSQQKVAENKNDLGLQLKKVPTSGSQQISTEIRQKIKENTKTYTYTGIIVVGVGVTAVMFWAIFKELFSSCSPNNIYSDALDRVIEDNRVQDAIGAPIKGYGEESRRGRRQHVAHASFERNGVLHIRMKFYVQGIRNKATVHLESRKNPAGKMEYRYLFVQLDHYPNTTIILEDNRAFDPSPSSTFLQSNINQTTLNGSNISLTAFDAKK